MTDRRRPRRVKARAALLLALALRIVPSRRALAHGIARSWARLRRRGARFRDQVATRCDMMIRCAIPRFVALRVCGCGE